MSFSHDHPSFEYMQQREQDIKHMIDISTGGE